MDFPEPAQVRAIGEWRSSRFHNDDPPKERTEQERDTDRIWYSGSLTRLQGVVQVVSAPRRIMFHNRYTHSVKVALLARRIAQRLRRQAENDYATNAPAYLAALGGLDPDVAEAAGLGHDLGHPPFGHHGEAVLNRLAPAGGFNGNAQTFRVVSQLAVRDIYPGLNLTRSTLLALVKYPWSRSQEPGRDERWGYYAEDKPLWDWLTSDRPSGLLPGVGDGTQPSLEALIMDWADDVTYAVHDVEDFFKAGVIPLHLLTLDKRNEDEKNVPDRLPKELWETWQAIIDQGYSRANGAFRSTERRELEGAAVRVTGELTASLVGLNEPFDGSSEHDALLTLMASRLIGAYSRAAHLNVPSTESPQTLVVDRKARAEVLLLKELAWYYVISRPGLAGIQFGQTKLLTRLHEELVGSLKRLRNDQAGGAVTDDELGDARLVPPRARERLARGDDVQTVTRDLLAGMSEDQVRDLALRWEGHADGNALDPIL